MRKLLRTWYEELPLKAEPVKTEHPINVLPATKLLLKKIKELLSIANALYDDKGQDKYLYSITRKHCLCFINNPTNEQNPYKFLTMMATEQTGLLYCLL